MYIFNELLISQTQTHRISWIRWWYFYIYFLHFSWYLMCFNAISTKFASCDDLWKSDSKDKLLYLCVNNVYDIVAFFSWLLIPLFLWFFFFLLISISFVFCNLKIMNKLEQIEINLIEKFEISLHIFIISSMNEYM